ncbi:MAG: terminase family protein [Verrucomicrobiae bacterium]|nr:terminase family protein [Verrucomicrobiae bacterium]
MSSSGKVRSKKGAGGAVASPLELLLPYQRAWVEDGARFKIGCWARQTGKSFATAAEAVADCLARKTTWVCLSAGERQALEWMLKAREWAEAFKLAVADYAEIRDAAEALLKAAEIKWGNGSRLVAIPANPATARGYSANLVLDEFAFHESPDAIWRAIFPSIANPLKGEFKIRVVSTPNGRGNKFADLWENAEASGWRRHRCNIYEAAAAGLPVNVEELRRGLNDPEGWAQEFECEFLDSSAVLLSYELIAGCESVEAAEAQPAEFWELGARGRRLVMGLDFARKRDLSVAWTLELLGEQWITREVLVMQGLSTPEQVRLLEARLAAVELCCVDYTGPGVGLGDYLVHGFGEYRPDGHRWGKVELCNFSNLLKNEIFGKLRMAFEERRVRVPVSRAVREDLHSVQRVGLQGGGITYRAPHTADGHADRCTALALAARAAREVGRAIRLHAELV